MVTILKYKNFSIFFKEHPEDRIVHVHGPNIAVACLKHAKKHGVPHRLCHSHNTRYADDLIRAIRNRLLLSGLGSCTTGYFSCSKAAGEFVIGNVGLFRPQKTTHLCYYSCTLPK